MIYEHICKHFAGRDIPIGNGNVIQVDDISSCGTMIEISCVPFEINNTMLTEMLLRFGDVYKCQSHFKRFGKYSKYKKSGKRTVWMNLREQIPQTLKFNQLQTSIYVKYENQPMSCNRCGHTGHKAWRCSRNSRDYKNLLEYKFMEPNETRTGNPTSQIINYEEKDSELDVNTSFTEIDIYTDPSQTTKSLECHLCEYTCNYDHILLEHMETHTGEKTDQCQEDSSLLNILRGTHIAEKSTINDIPKITSEGRDANNVNGAAYVNEILLECTECDYKCKNKDKLLNHLKFHNIYACDKCDFKGISPKGLTAHKKNHKRDQFKCTKCDYTGSTISKLNIHLKSHTEDQDVINMESLFELESLQTSGKTPLTSNSAKRGLSVSPEMVNTDKKSTSINSSKKSRNYN